MAKVGRMVKETAVKELSARLSERSNVFVTSINRLPAVEADALRQKLHGAQGRLLIVKRTLGQRAIEQLSIAGLTGLFEGSVGLVLAGDDVLLAAKTIVEFVKMHEEQLVVRGALIDGMLLDKVRVEHLAGLPPKPILLAQVVAAIEAPIADIVFTIERLIGELAWALEQAAAKKPLPAPPPNTSVGGPAASEATTTGAVQAGAAAAPHTSAPTDAPAEPTKTTPASSSPSSEGQQPTPQEGAPS